MELQVPPTYRSPLALATFCGEAPGRQEVIAKEGFVGGSGKLWERCIRGVGLTRDSFNLSNVVKRRPPDDDFGIFYHDPKERKHPKEELLAWHQLLRAELQRFQPNVFVAAGMEAVKAVCSPAITRSVAGKGGITKFQGSILISDIIPGMKVIPVVHPAWIMRNNWEYFYISRRFFERVKVEMKSREVQLKQSQPRFIIRPSFEQTIGFIKIIQDNPDSAWDIDIETVGDKLACFGLSCEANPGEVICNPIEATNGPYWTEAEEVMVWRELAKAFKLNPNCENQNLPFDLEYLISDYRMEPSGFGFDPMIAMNVAYPEFPRALEFSTAMFTYIPYYKDQGKTWGKKHANEEGWYYNCKDMWATPLVSQALKQDLKEKGLWDVYWNLSHRFIPIALEMQRNRLPVDESRRQWLSDLLIPEIMKTHEKLTQVIGEDINVRSGVQVQDVLFNKLRLPVKKKRGTQTVTTQEQALKELKADFPQVLALQLIMEERHLLKKLSDYINVKRDPDGHIPTACYIGGAETGRWSFGKSAKWRGTNIHTFPKVMRLMVCPPPGLIFGQRDLSQAEVRIVSKLAKCNFLEHVFAAGRSVHKEVGSGIFRKSYDTIEKDGLEYDTSKRIVHAYDYMMSWKRLATEAEVPYVFAKEVYEKYGSLVPEISNWHQQIKAKIFKDGQLETPFGRRREFFKACGAIANTGVLPDDCLRDAVSYIPQATVPDILNTGMFKLWEAMGETVRMHQQGHDSYLCSFPPVDLAEVAERSAEMAQVSVTIDYQELTIPSEFTWGYLWGAMKSYEKGDNGSYEQWSQWANDTGQFDEAKVRVKLYGVL